MKITKFLLTIFALLLFSNCGYKPIYSTTNKNSDEFLYIKIKNIEDRSGQILKNELFKQLNPENKRSLTKYHLSIKIGEDSEALAYRKDMSATRTNLKITAKYSLRSIKNGNIIFESTTESISSYDIVESIYATIIAEKDARKKALKIISDTIINELAIFFNN